MYRSGYLPQIDQFGHMLSDELLGPRHKPRLSTLANGPQTIRSSVQMLLQMLGEQGQELPHCQKLVSENYGRAKESRLDLLQAVRDPFFCELFGHTLKVRSLGFSAEYSAANPYGGMSPPNYHRHCHHREPGGATKRLRGQRLADEGLIPSFAASPTGPP